MNELLFTALGGLIASVGTIAGYFGKRYFDKIDKMDEVRYNLYYKEKMSLITEFCIIFNDIHYSVAEYLVSLEGRSSRYEDFTIINDLKNCIKSMLNYIFLVNLKNF